MEGTGSAAGRQHENWIPRQAAVEHTRRGSGTTATHVGQKLRRRNSLLVTILLEGPTGITRWSYELDCHACCNSEFTYTAILE